MMKQEIFVGLVGTVDKHKRIIPEKLIKEYIDRDRNISVVLDRPSFVKKLGQGVILPGGSMRVAATAKLGLNEDSLIANCTMTDQGRNFIACMESKHGIGYKIRPRLLADIERVDGINIVKRIVDITFDVCAS